MHTTLSLHQCGRWNRKPATWNEIHAEIVAADLPEGLATFEAADLGLFAHPLADFADGNRPSDHIFLVRRGSKLYVVNTEGHGYARYWMEVI